ncbi:MAG: patatin-like phospholipase family protein, partial [Bacteroidales bacterium]|nr:patatin-like phospholipase family protein [Bacteroidales bacterium]
MEKKDTLYLGLCLAGAVSAGAYTAGVIDFLIEALEEWESRRGQPDVPSHRVVIPAIGGASAGGMTATILASAINNHVKPVRKLTGDIFTEQPENKLYHTWVDLTTTDMFPVLLDNGDINGQVYSLFNSQFIDELSHRI